VVRVTVAAVTPIVAVVKGVDAPGLAARVDAPALALVKLARADPRHGARVLARLPE
jgi:hypothetical protein